MTPINIEKGGTLATGQLPTYRKMDNIQNVNTSPQTPLDLYAEFARLCKAPASLDRDGQVALFEEYEWDYNEWSSQYFDEVKDEEGDIKFELNIPVKTFDELAYTFTQNWVAKAKIQKNPSKGVASQPSPEFYAEYVRRLVDWACLDEEKQEDVAKKAVKQAGRNEKRMLAKIESAYAANPEFLRFGNTPSASLFGLEFDEYVNEAWIDFSSAKSKKDTDAIVRWLEKYSSTFDKMFLAKKERMLKKIENEWDKLLESKKTLTDEEFINYLASEETEKKQQLEIQFGERAKADFDLIVVISHLSQNRMQRILSPKIAEAKRKKLASTESLGNGQALPVERTVIPRDILKRTMDALSEEDQKIMRFYLLGYSQTEIAERLTISHAKVSNHMKKIRAAAHAASM